MSNLLESASNDTAVEIVGCSSLCNQCKMPAKVASGRHAVTNAVAKEAGKAEIIKHATLVSVDSAAVILRVEIA